MESFLSSMSTLDKIIYTFERTLNAPLRKSPFEKVLHDHGLAIKKVRELPVLHKKKDHQINSFSSWGNHTPSQNNAKKAEKSTQNIKKSSPQSISLASSSKSSVQGGYEGKKAGFKPIEGKKDVVKNPLPESDPAEKAFEDFRKCDLRVGEFKKVWKHPDSNYLYCELIDIKTEIREIASGLQDDVPIEGMSGKTIVFANLKMKKLGGFSSNGMILCSNTEQKNFDILRPHNDAELGERVYLEGEEEYSSEPEKQISSKIRERVLKNFFTNAQGFPVFFGKRLRTKTGLLKPSKNLNGNVD